MRKPIQVATEVKEKLDVLRTPHRVNTHSEKVEYLMEQLHEYEAYKREVFEEKRLIEEDMKANFVHAGEEIKADFMEIADELNLSESRLLEVLIAHYNHSMDISKNVLSLILKR